MIVGVCFGPTVVVMLVGWMAEAYSLTWEVKVVFGLAGKLLGGVACSRDYEVVLGCCKKELASCLETFSVSPEKVSVGASPRTR